MTIKKIAEITWYLFFFVCALAFVKIHVEEYMNGSTSFSSTRNIVTLDDLPTIIFCLDKSFIYRKHLKIDVSVKEKKRKTVTLIIDENVSNFMALFEL